MKITHKKYPNHNLANEEERGENLGVDFILSSILGILAVTIVYMIYTHDDLSYTDYLKGFGIYLSVRFIYYFAFELSCSRTPGKFQTQTKVVNKHGKKPNPFQLFVRNLSRFLSVFSGISDDERAIHDQISNTFVVQDRSLKRIESRQPMIILFNSLLALFWVYYLTTEPKTSSTETIVLIALILATIYAVIVIVKKMGSK